LIFALRLRLKLKLKQIPFIPPFSKGEVLQPYFPLWLCESLWWRTDCPFMAHLQEPRYLEAVFCRVFLCWV